MKLIFKKHQQTHKKLSLSKKKFKKTVFKNFLHPKKNL